MTGTLSCPTDGYASLGVSAIEDHAAWSRAAEHTIVRCFAGVAQQHSSSAAAVQGNVSITYSHLDAESNRLARYLRAQGVKPGQFVALLGGRSIAAITAILAILKAGAAYVPLDQSYPAELLRFMIKNCAPALLLADACAMDNLQTGAPALGLDDALSEASGESPGPLIIEAGPEQPAYVMYTSGSTGRPKGVIVPHRAVVRLVLDQSFVHFGANETFLHAAPLAFDASTLEIWGALLHGGRIAVVPDIRPSLDAICEAIERHGVTTAWFTAGLFHLLVDRKVEDLRPLRQLVAGGDVVSPSHVLRAYKALPECRIVNGYGPTENTTFTCCYEIPRAGRDFGSIPIGMPIEHTYVRILDDDMKPVRDGEIGQLCAGGCGLALGYLGDAQRTSERFVPDPYAPGAHLYLTGDLVRRRSDGPIEFIGRCDRQIKIDGKRVELGEIEETIRRMTAISDAVVVLHDEGAGAKRLVGYVVPKAGFAAHTALAHDTQMCLRSELPAHMVPSEIVVLDGFPLNPNGKVDVSKLAPSQSPRQSAMDTERTDFEKELAGVFEQVLQTPNIGLSSNFFDLGATSLKLLEAHEAITQICGHFDVMALFQNPTVKDLAAFLKPKPTSIRQTGAVQERAQRQNAALERLRNRTLAQ